MKRTFQLATVLGTVFCSNAFVSISSPTYNSHGPFRTQPSVSRIPLLQAKKAVKSKIDNRHGWFQGTKQLPHEEQSRLLQQVVEHRRIKTVETELRLSKRTLTSLQLSRASGYGDDLIGMEDAIQQGEVAREQLITSNMGLVYYSVNDIIKTKKMQHLQFDDLIQEGAIGLSRAVARWNPEIGGKFSTFAVYWIRAAILRNIAEQDDLVKVPEYINGILSKIHKTSGWKEYESAKLLAEAAGISDSQLQLALKVKKQRNMPALSFESWMQNGRSFETDLRANDSEETASATGQEEDLASTLAQFLRPKEMEALSWRYGLNNQQQQFSSTGKQGEAMSFKDVGKHMKISAEYGRQLCLSAIQKLQQAADEGTLEPAFFGN